MKKCLIKRLGWILIISLMFTLVFGVNSMAADDYPDGTIEMIVAYSAGGGTDVTARPLARILEDILGTDIVIRNITGAGGEIGFTQLADSEPDGYTIGFINTPHVVNHYLERDTGYHPLESFRPLVNPDMDPGALAVPADSPFETLEDLIEYSEENTITYGTSGYGGDNHIVMREFGRDTGSEWVHVPFDGAATAITAGMGGHTTAVAAKISELGLYHPDDLRMIAFSGDERHDNYLDVPTFKELGYELAVPWEATRGIVAPAGISDKKADILINAILDALETEEWEKAVEEMGIEVGVLVGDEYAAYIEEVFQTWGQIYEEYPW